jgi:hypothetical protein
MRQAPFPSDEFSSRNSSFGLSEICSRFNFAYAMKSAADTNDSKDRRLIRFASLRRAPRDLPLVKWAAWAVIVGVIAFLVFVIWGLATHDPSQDPSTESF